MSGRSPHQRTAYPPLGQEVSPALFRHQRFWAKLSVYRPLLILAGIWVGLVVIAIVAYGQLLHTQTATTADAPTPVTASTTAPEAEGDRDIANTLPTNRPLNQLSGNDFSGTTPTPFTESPTPTVTPAPTVLSPGALLSLVAVCALGCFVISRQLQRPPRPRRRVRPSEHHPTPRSPQSRNPQPQKPQSQNPQSRTPQPPVASLPKMAPYDPSQPLMSTPTPRSGSPAQPQPPERSVAPAAPPVTVVGDAVQHRLDWPQDSLINTEDIRQRRSLSSFM